MKMKTKTTPVLRVACACLAASLLPVTTPAAYVPLPPPGLSTEVVPEVLHSFTAGPQQFNDGFIVGGDGSFYCISQGGGAHGAGCIFRVTPGGDLTIAASFGERTGGARGVAPVGRLAFDGVDKYYGVTREGGRFGGGTVFRMDSSGTVETLVDLSYDGAASAAYPVTGLTKGADGFYYGTAYYSGDDYVGSIFRVSKDGGFQVLAKFTGRSGALPGAQPDGQMVLRPDGSLIGATSGGGKMDQGTVFRIAPNGTVSSVGEFTGLSGALPGSHPDGPLAVATDGTVYGTTVNTYLDGQTIIPQGVWKLPPTGAPSQVTTFGGESAHPTIFNIAGGVAVDASGNAVISVLYTDTEPYGGIYSVTPTGQVALVAAFDSIITGDTFTFSYRGPSSDGAGGFVGTIDYSIYRVDGSHLITELAKIDEDGPSNEGAEVDAQVLFNASGDLFARTSKGSDNHHGAIVKLPAGGPLIALAPNSGNYYYNYFQSNQLALDQSGFVVDIDTFADEIFALDPVSGSRSVVQSFPVFREFSTLDFPQTGLIADGSGGFFGLADDYQNVTPFGTKLGVYHLTASGVELVADIDKNTNSVYSQLTLTPGGDLLLVNTPYDTKGSVLKITQAGVVTTLADFNASSNQTKTASPVGPLYVEASGSVLAFTRGYFEDDGGPAVVRISPSGQIMRIAFLPGYNGEDSLEFLSNPLGAATVDASGNIYGVSAYGGGADSQGGIFRVSATGESSLLYAFRFDDGLANVGGRPLVGLVKGPDGAIYGSTSIGGALGGGTLFRFSPSASAQGVTVAPTIFDARTATFTGEISDNGYAGEYWYEYGTDAGTLTSATDHVLFGGFSGTALADQAVTGLKGHRTYYVRLKVKIGTTILDGPVVSFTTPNGAPTAENDVILSEKATGPFVGRVLENDIDLDDDAITIETFEQPQFGTVTLNAGVFTYVPGATFQGKDSFTYTINDGLGLTATATVQVLTTAEVAGEYAGLIFDEKDFQAAVPRPGARGAAGAPPLEQTSPKARGFMTFYLTGRREFTAKFDVDGTEYSLKQQLDLEKPTGFQPKKGGGLVGTMVPSDTGISGSIKLGNRTILFRAARSFAALGMQRPETTFTARLEPTVEANPLNSNGLPAGNGFALIRVSKKGKTSVAGVLPDGTPFARGSVIDGNDRLPFLTRLYKKKKGSFEGELKVVDGGNVDDSPGRLTKWLRPSDTKEKRFPGGIDTALRVYGGKFTAPAGNAAPLDLGTGTRVTTRFRRGGLFDEVASVFEVKGKKEKVVTTLDEALATLKFKSKAGLFSGTIRRKETGKKPVNFRGIFTQRDNSGAGYFLGPADGGSVVLEVGG